jgi:hypothetical protein
VRSSRITCTCRFDPDISQMRVIDAPLDLPDGCYTLVVDSRVYSTEKREGWWEMVRVERATA